MMSRMTMITAVTSAVMALLAVGSVATSEEKEEGFVGCEASSTCPCPKNMDPVCDAQGKIYSNGCILDCVKSRCTGEQVPSGLEPQRFRS